MRKRILPAFLTLSMLLTCLPLTALAEDSKAASKPALTALTVQDEDGETVSLLNRDEAITVSLGTTYVFEAAFSNAEQIGKVYITSTKEHEKKFLEASYDEESGTFRSNGLFDGDGSYLPGEIGVEYTRKVDAVAVGDSVDWGTLQAALGDNCTAAVNSISGEAIEATVDVSRLLDGERDAAIHVVVDVFDEATGGDLNEWLGYYHDLESVQKRVLEGGRYYLYLDDTAPETYIAMVIRDVSGSKYTKLILSEVGAYSNSLAEIAEDLSRVNLVSGIVYDCLDIQKSAEELREEIAAAPTISESQRAELNAQVDAYENDWVYFALLTALLPAVVTAAGGMMAGPAIAFNALLSAITAASGTFWEYRVGLLLGGEATGVSFSSGADSHGVPLTRDFLLNNDITQSGQYYLSESVISVQIGGSGAAVDVTLCLHGQKVLSSISVGDGSVLHLCDCTYLERADGSVTGGQAAQVNVGAGSELIFSGGIINGGITGGGGAITIAGGMVKGKISSTDGGRITVEGGAIDNSISAEDSGEVIVYDGYVRDISMESGSAEIYGGQIGSCLWTDCGTILIDGGLIGSGDASAIAAVTNSGGIVEMRGGTIMGWVFNGADGTVYMNGGELLCSRGDSDHIAGNYSAITNEGGNVVISGGVVKGTGKGTRCIENNAGGSVTINGGTLQSVESGCMENHSVAVITGGALLASGIDVYNNGGTVTISGGVFQSEEGDCVYNYPGGAVTISGGYFQGIYGISDYRGDSNTLLIGNGSVIEINGEKAAFHSYSGATIALSPRAGYKGGVIYYPEADAAGIAMTMEEAAEIDFSAPYLRLAAGTVTLAVSPSYGEVYSVKAVRENDSVSLAVTALAASGTDTVLHACLAQYDGGGRMTGLSTLPCQVTEDGFLFSGEVPETAYKLFLLDGDWQPVSEAYAGK